MENSKIQVAGGTAPAGAHGRPGNRTPVSEINNTFEIETKEVLHINPNTFIEMSSKSRRVLDVIGAMFSMIPNNVRGMRNMVGFGFFIDRGRVDIIPCATTIITQKPLDDNLVLCLLSAIQLCDGEVAQRIVEVARTSEQYRRIAQETGKEPEILPLLLVFLPTKLQLGEVREGSYWEKTTTEYIYDLVPIGEETNIVAYVALIPNRVVIPVDVSQLEEVISTVHANWLESCKK